MLEATSEVGGLSKSILISAVDALNDLSICSMQALIIFIGLH